LIIFNLNFKTFIKLTFHSVLLSQWTFFHPSTFNFTSNLINENSLPIWRIEMWSPISGKHLLVFMMTLTKTWQSSRSSRSFWIKSNISRCSRIKWVRNYAGSRCKSRKMIKRVREFLMNMNNTKKLPSFTNVVIFFRSTNPTRKNLQP